MITQHDHFICMLFDSQEYFDLYKYVFEQFLSEYMHLLSLVGAYQSEGKRVKVNSAIKTQWVIQ